jgi:amino acid transporter
MEKPSVYVRRATGLIRAMSPKDYFFYAVANPNLSGMSYLYIWMAITFFGADMTIATILCMVVCFFLVSVFAMFSSAMPRAASVSYVATSRVLNPPLGFALSWSWMYAIIFFAAWTGWAFSAIGLGDGLVMLGYLFNIPVLVEWAKWCLNPFGIFIIGAIVIIFSYLLLILGKRTYFAVLNPLTIIAIIGAVALVAVLAASSREIFISMFNKFMLPYAPETPDYYHYIINTAMSPELGEGAYPGFKFSWVDTIGAMSIPFVTLAFPITAELLAGEVKKGESLKMQFSALNGSLLLLGVLMAAGAWFAVRLCGHEFLGSAGWLFWYHPELFASPAPPYIHFFAGLVSPPPLAVFIVVSFIIWHLIYAIALAGMLPPLLFAWAFDRLLPEWITRISRRFRTPVNNYLTCCGIILICLALYAFTPWPHVLNTFMVNAVMFMMIGIAAIIFPWRRPTIYKASPISRYHPLATLFGIGCSIGMGIIAYYFITYGPLGINEPFSLVIAIWGAYCVAPLWWYFARAYRRRQGIDIDLAYKEVPPA